MDRKRIIEDWQEDLKEIHCPGSPYSAELDICSKWDYVSRTFATPQTPMFLLLKNKEYWGHFPFNRLLGEYNAAKKGEG
jgi:hypothetical protein